MFTPAYPIKIARTRGVTRVSRELRAFRRGEGREEAVNEPPGKKVVVQPSMTVEPRTNVCLLFEISGDAKRKKRKGKKGTLEKFLKSRFEAEGRSGRDESREVVSGGKS